MEDVKAIALTLLGWVNQWVLFAPKKVPMWLAYGLLVLSSGALWWWMTPDALAQFGTNWRTAIGSVVVFALAARGGAGALKDLHVAPPTDSK